MGTSLSESTGGRREVNVLAADAWADRGAQFKAQVFLSLLDVAEALRGVNIAHFDSAHDAVVGHALRLAFAEGRPRESVRMYNAFARANGYGAIAYLGQRSDGSLLIDLADAVIAVSPDAQVSLVVNRWAEAVRA